MKKWESLEIQIPVSYGFIAAKAWGDPSSEPVLALHGWQDNAGTFDRLVPLLNSDLYIVAMDGPGHGWSSHKPIGAFYHYMEMLVDIKRVISFLKWEKFSMMGHSLGGTLALLYASIFPENVKNVISLDIVKPASRETKQLPDVTRNGINELLMVESKLSNPPPVYTMEEAHKRLIAGMYKEITSESATVLLRRGCKPSDCGKGVVYCRDIRVQVSDLQKLSHDDLKCFLKRMKCNLLLVLGTKSSVYRSRTPEVLDEFIELYGRVCSSLHISRVEGNHFVHLNEPELVAPHVDNFFQKYCCKLSKM